ncbi:IclR family transcriptional regulator [Amycolatopsis anabasis]|uniref:IclR family transcriptional regulator n=1 Tax=Amycolatopsis anabasis TaxID=1840409 RepID=UPI00131CD4F6|nr:IclR family transcriptional regulator [Amycolatopsis anabasis]
MNRAVNDRPGEARGSVDKALDVLTALVRPDGPHRLAEIARQTGLAKPTVHRMLQTMTESGFAVGEGGSYHVGPRLLGLAAAALAGSRETRFTGPVLAELQRRTGHTVHYAVRHGRCAVYVEKVEPDQAYRMTSRVGGEVPLYCTAVGRAMLARLPEAEVAAVLDTEPLPARTPHTLTDPARIRAALSEVDERGYLVEDEQNEPHVRCVAAPVVDGLGQVAGAISVSGLTFTLTTESVPVLGPLVADAAARVSAALASGPVRLVGGDA